MLNDPHWSYLGALLGTDPARPQSQYPKPMQQQMSHDPKPLLKGTAMTGSHKTSQLLAQHTQAKHAGVAYTIARAINGNGKERHAT